MGLLADAYADAHLNLSTLDADLVKADRRLRSAIAAMESAAEIVVRVETGRAAAELRSLETLARDVTAVVAADVDTASLIAARERLASLDTTVSVRVDLDTTAALAELAALESLVAGLGSTVNVGASRRANLPDVPTVVSPTVVGVGDQVTDQVSDAMDTLSQQLSGIIETFVGNSMEVALDRLASAGPNTVTTAMNEARTQLPTDLSVAADAMTTKVRDGLTKAADSVKPRIEAIKARVAVQPDVDEAPLERALKRFAVAVSGEMADTDFFGPIGKSWRDEGREVLGELTEGIRALPAADFFGGDDRFDAVKVRLADLGGDLSELSEARRLRFDASEITQATVAASALSEAGEDVGRTWRLELAGVVARLGTLREGFDGEWDFEVDAGELLTAAAAIAAQKAPGGPLSDGDVTYTVDLDTRNFRLAELEAGLARLFQARTRFLTFDRNEVFSSLVAGSELAAKGFEQTWANTIARVVADIGELRQDVNGDWKLDVDTSVLARRVALLRAEWDGLIADTDVSYRVRVEGQSMVDKLAASLRRLREWWESRSAQRGQRGAINLDLGDGTDFWGEGDDDGGRRRGRGLLSRLGDQIGDVARTAFEGVQSLVGGLKSVADAGETMVGSLGAASDGVGILSDGTANLGEQAGGAGKALSGLVSNLAAAAGPIGQAALAALAVAGGGALAVGGILALGNGLAALAATAAGALTAVAALASGLIGAAAGLVVFGGLAGATIAGVAASILLLSDTMSQFKQLFSTLQVVINSVLVDSLKPIQQFLLGEFAAALGIVIQGIATLAPYVISSIEPVTSGLLDMMSIFAEVAGPLAQEMGSSIGQMIDILNGFFSSLDPAVVLEGVTQFGNVIEELLTLLGEAGINFPLNELLKSFADTLTELTPAFRTINALFREGFAGAAGGIADLLRPARDLAIQLTETIVNLLPYIDDFWTLITAVFPLGNFEVLAELFDRIGLSFIAFYERMGPTIEQAAALMGEVALTFLSQETINSFVVALEVAVIAIRDLGLLLVENRGVVDLFASALVAMVLTIPAAMSAVAALAGVVMVAVGNMMDAGAQMARLLAELFRAINANPLGDRLIPDDALGRFESATKRIGEMTSGTKQLGIDLIGLSVNIQRNMVGGMKAAGTATDKTRGSVDKFSVSIETAAGTITKFGSDARRAAALLAQVNVQYAGQIQALGAFRQKLGESGIGNISEYIKDETDRQEKEAKRATGSLSNFLNEQRDTVEKSQKQTINILRESSVSQWMNEENFDIDRALRSVVQTLRSKIASVQRLSVLVGMGFTALAQQLATLSSDPKVLAKALDDLFASGVDAMRGYENDLRGAQGQLEQLLRGVDPALGEALGVPKETTAAIEETGFSIGAAMDRMAKSQALRVKNLSRIGDLYKRGFTDLAVELTTLDADPEQLDQALSQLAAGGEGAFRSANERLASGNAAVASTIAALPDVIREQVSGAAEEAGVEAAKPVEEVNRSFNEAFQEMVNDQNRNLFKIGVLGDLSKKGYTVLATQMAGLEPDVFFQWYSELAAQGEEGFANANEILTSRGVELAELLATLDPQVAAALGLEPGSATREQIDAFLKEATGFSIGAKGLAVAKDRAVGAGAETGSAMVEGFTKDLEGLVPAAEEGMDDATKALKRKGEEMAPVGADAARRFAAGLDEGMVAVKLAASLGAVDVGLTFSKVFASALAAGSAGAVKALTDMSTRAAEAGRSGFGLAGTQSGAAAISGLDVAFVVGQPLVVLRVTTLAQSMVAELDRVLAPGFADAGADAVAALMRGVETALPVARLLLGVQLGVVGVELGKTLQSSVVSGLGSVADTAAAEGLRTGVAFMSGINLGLTLAAPGLEVNAAIIGARIAAAVRQALDINSPSGVGRSIGQQFGDGLREGLIGAARELVPVAGQLGSVIADGVAATALPPVFDPQLVAVGTPQPQPQPVPAVIGSLSGLTEADAVSILRSIEALLAGRPPVNVENYNVVSPDPTSPRQFAEDVDRLAAGLEAG